MLKLNLSNSIAALCGTLLLVGCPDDPLPSDTDASTGESTSTGPVVTTVPVDSTTTDPDTTIGVESTTTGDPDTTVGIDSTTGDPTTTGESTTTGEPPTGVYGDCANIPEAEVCSAGEICLDGGGSSVCALQECQDATDCAAAPSGDAVVSCFDVDNSGTDDCYLDCGMGEACPDGMICAFDFICMWQLIPAGGGMCPDEDLGNVVPQAIVGDNTGLFDDHVSACGAGGGEDSMYQFTAEVDGTYVFDTAGTEFDTALAVLDGCGGMEIACNDDSGIGMELTSLLEVPMVAGQSVIVVVDSFDGEVGPFNLNISLFEPGACPDQDLGNTVPQSVMGDNTGLVDDNEASCAPGGDDALYQFTAPADGTYVFDTVGTMYDTVLAVVDGCGGMELDCSDDVAMMTTSQITIDLTAGQSVIVAVEGYGGLTGPFTLNISSP